MRRRIERTRGGGFRVRLPAEERELLRALPGQLRALLQTDDPSLVRLFPPAYGDDEEANAAYNELVRDDLLRGRLDALQVLEETADAERLDEEQLSAWVGALNDFRLVLGTRLGVTEDMYSSPAFARDPEHALYGYLTWLQEEAIQAASETR
jgi:Domain of unknown function (DUF2017)